jgi:hypothetical protein
MPFAKLWTSSGANRPVLLQFIPALKLFIIFKVDTHPISRLVHCPLGAIFSSTQLSDEIKRPVQEPDLRCMFLNHSTLPRQSAKLSSFPRI